MPRPVSTGESSSRWDEAMKHKHMITVPKEAEYHLQRAMDAQGRDAPETILAHFELALSSEPAYAAAWNEKANFLDSVGNFDEALACYDCSLKIDPGNAEVWFNKGLTLRKLGRENEAFSCINRGIDLACGE
jgi:tetratricopeptide (TPR) repeat protein